MKNKGAKISAVTRDLFQKVRELHLPFGEYALFGSCPLGIRGIRECNDADIIVSKSLFEKFRGMPGWELRITTQGGECLTRDMIELFWEWRPGVWDIGRLIAEAEIIDGLPFVRLQSVLESKKMRALPKDIPDIEAILEFLGTWKLFTKSTDVWEAMLRDSAEAKTTINMESYIFVVDEIGKRFLELFKRKVQEGVRVRVICDMVGSYSFFNSSDAKALAAAGVEIRFFNPIRPWRVGMFGSFFHRDHRKVLIIDSRIGYTGGVNIVSRMSGWRDTHVRIEGAVLREMSHAFERMWASTTYEKGFLKRFRRPYVVNSSFSYLTSAPYLRQRFVYRKMLQALRGAKRYAFFTTPYFVPSVRLFSALQRAASRNVDVRILIPETSDVRMVDIAAGAYFTLALKSNIKIYRYRKSILHVKSAVIDGEWGTVGSANLDNISLLSNYEGNLVGREKNFIQELKNHFLNDLAVSDELKHDDWIRRPFLRKFLEMISWPVHRIL